MNHAPPFAQKNWILYSPNRTGFQGCHLSSRLGCKAAEKSSAGSWQEAPFRNKIQSTPINTMDREKNQRRLRPENNGRKNLCSLGKERLFQSGQSPPKPQSESRRIYRPLASPNITGSLHMGHALNATIEDILVRYRRMKGL